MVKVQKIAFFLSVVLLAVILAGIFFTCLPSVSAEESTDKYVVFNQYIHNGNFVNGDDWTLLDSSIATLSFSNNVMTHKLTSVPTWNYEAGFNNNYTYFNAGHIYYTRFYVKPTRNAKMFLSYNNKFSYTQDIVANSFNMVDVRYSTEGTNYPLFYMDYSNSTVNELSYFRDFISIDLTQMFGAGKEPSIDFCRNLFVSNYYPYISNGSVISLDGFSNYNQGVSDTLNSFSTTLVYSTLRRGAYIYDKLGMTEISDVNFDYSDYKYPELIMAGITAIPFNLVIKANSTVIVESNTFSSTSIRYFNFGYLNNGNIVPLYSFDNYTDYDTVYFTFITPIDIDTIYVYGSNVYMGTPIQQISTLGNISFSFTSFDNSLFLSNSYDTGYDSGYNIGYNSGYNKGYNKGLSIGADKQYSFAGLLDAVVQAPITALIGSYDSSGKRVGGLLNFNFLGVNLSFFFTGLLSVTIVIVIIRFILARK